MQEDCCGGCGSPSDRGACYVRAAAQLTPHLNIVAHRCCPAGYIGGLPGLRSLISYMAVWEWNGYIIWEKDPGDLKGLYLAYKSAVLLLLLALVAYFS